MEQRLLDKEEEYNNTQMEYYETYDDLQDSFRGRGMTKYGVASQEQSLAREYDKKLKKLKLKYNQLYIEYERLFY